MYLIYCDETNINPNEHDFFVFGSLVVPINKAAELSDKIADIRKQKGFQPTDELKFNSSSRPKKISTEIFKETKQEVIQALTAAEAGILFSITSHKIATSTNLARRYAINTAMLNVDKLLESNKIKGKLFIDSFETKKKEKENTDLRKILTDSFQLGVKIQNKYTPIKHIISYNISYSGTSHLSSAADIAIGGFRYWLNNVGKPELKEKNAAILKSMSELFVVTPKKKVASMSVSFSPHRVTSTIAFNKYKEVKDRFEEDTEMSLEFFVKQA